MNHNLRFLVLFIVSVLAFITTYGLTSTTADALKTGLGEISGNSALGGLVSETLRLVLAVCAAGFVASLLIRSHLVPRVLVEQTYVAPIRDFFDRHARAAIVILLLIGTYRIADIVMGVIANVFYADMGFSKSQIASVTKVFGLLMTLVGGLVGGVLSLRYGVMRILWLGALLAAVSNLLFAVLAELGPSEVFLMVTVGADNLSAGIASAAFVAYLSSLTNLSFTAMQYAIFSSLMTLLPKVLAGYSGAIVDSLGYKNFFIASALLGLPVLLLVVLAARLDRAPSH